MELHLMALGKRTHTSAGAAAALARGRGQGLCTLCIVVLTQKAVCERLRDQRLRANVMPALTLAKCSVGTTWQCGRHTRDT